MPDSPMVRESAVLADLKHALRRVLMAQRQGRVPAQSDVDAVIRLRAELTEIRRGRT